MKTPKWSKKVDETTVLPINLFLPKAYVMGDVEYNAPHWTRVFSVDGELAVVRVRQKKPLTPEITIEYESNVDLSDEEIELLRSKIRYEIGADDNLQALRETQEKDILVKLAVKDNAGFRLFANSNTVEAAVCTIIQQNVDFAGFQVILKELTAKYGTQVPWEPNLYLFPENHILEEMSIEDWEELGIGLKSKYLGSLTKRTLKDIQTYAYYPIFDRGIDGLKRIDGIGDYTSRMIMIYAARRYEKAFIDGYVQEILDHKYKLHQVLPLTEYDKWMEEHWPNDPALILHTHLQDYLPAYIRDYDFEALGRSTV
ncbi:MAG: hypothetical protein ACXAE3_14295 [Candidatus Kariarchaeaceae archaeon]